MSGPTLIQIASLLGLQIFSKSHARRSAGQGLITMNGVARTRLIWTWHLKNVLYKDGETQIGWRNLVLIRG